MPFIFSIEINPWLVLHQTLYFVLINEWFDDDWHLHVFKNHIVNTDVLCKQGIYKSVQLLYLGCDKVCHPCSDSYGLLMKIPLIMVLPLFWSSFCSQQSTLKHAEVIFLLVCIKIMEKLCVCFLSIGHWFTSDFVQCPPIPKLEMGCMCLVGSNTNTIVHHPHEVAKV